MVLSSYTSCLDKKMQYLLQPWQKQEGEKHMK